MGLVQDEHENENKVKKMKTSLIIIGIFIFILVIAAVVIYIYQLKIQEGKLKVRIDGIYSTELANSSNLFLIEDNKVLVSIKEISKHIGYTAYNGAYKQYTEDTSSCYASSQNETVTFTGGSKIIRKYPKQSNSESQEFELEDEIYNRANNLYININDSKRAFNTIFDYNKETNTISITTLDYLTSSYAKTFKNSYFATSDKDNTSQKDNSKNFNNQKALLENLVVIKADASNLLGVAKNDNGTLNTIITERYRSVEFIEGICDFIVLTEENKYGIINKEGITKVNPTYDEIKEINKDLGLYLVTSNGKQGIINQYGKIIVYQDYDKIGLDDNFQDNNISSKYLLLDTCIPIKVNEKWGLIDIDGKQILPAEYDGIGCKITENITNTTGVVVIPAMKGIVIEQDIKSGNNTIKKYGIIDPSGTLMMAYVADSVYATTTENKTNYYVSTDNNVYDIVEYWNQQKSNANSGENEQSTQQNAIGAEINQQQQQQQQQTVQQQTEQQQQQSAQQQQPQQQQTAQQQQQSVQQQQPTQQPTQQQQAVQQQPAQQQ